MPQLINSMYLTLDNIEVVFCNFHELFRCCVDENFGGDFSCTENNFVGIALGYELWTASMKVSLVNSNGTGGAKHYASEIKFVNPSFSYSSNANQSS